jgi:hypothetical protein
LTADSIAGLQFGLHEIYSVLVKENYQITISSLTKHPKTNCHTIKTTEELKNSTFLNKYHHFMDHNWFCEPAILATRNSNVNNINLNL